MRVYILLLMASSVGSTVVYVRLDSTNHSLAALPTNLINQCAKGCEKTVGCSGFSIISLQCSLLSSFLPSSPYDISFVRTIPTSPTCPAGSKHFATFGQNPPTVLQSSSETSLATSSSSSIGAETSTSPLSSQVMDVTHERLTDRQTSVSSTLVGIMTTVHSKEESALSSANVQTGRDKSGVSSTHVGVMTTVHVNEGETSMSGKTSKTSGRSSGTTDSSTSTISIPTSTNLSTGMTSSSSTTTRTLSDSKIHPSSSTIFSSVPVKSTMSTESIPSSLPSTISSLSTMSSLPSASITRDAAMSSATKGAGSSTALSSSTSSTSAPSSTFPSSVATTATESSTSTTTTSIPTSASVSMSTSTPSSTSATTIEPTTTRSSTSIATSPMAFSTTTTELSTTSTASTSTTSTVSSTAPSTSFPGTTAPSTATSILTTTAPTSITTTTESTSTSTTRTSISSPSSTTTSPSSTIHTTTSATTPSTSTSTSSTSTSPSSTILTTSMTTPSVTSTSTSTSTTKTTSPTTTEYNVLEKFTFVDVPGSNVSCYYEIRSGGRFSTNGLCSMKGSDPCKEEGLVSVFGNCAGMSALTVVDSTRCVSTLMYSSSTLCVPWEAMFVDKVNPTASGNATSQNCPSGTGLAVSSVCTSNPLGVTMMTGRYTDNLLGFTAGGTGLMISSCWSTADNLQVSYCPVAPGYNLQYCPQSGGNIGWIRTSAKACQTNDFFLNMGAAPCAFHSMLVAGSGGSRCIGWDSGSTTTPFSDSLTQGSSWYEWNGTSTKALRDGTIMGRLLTYEEYMILPRVLVTPSP